MCVCARARAVRERERYGGLGPTYFSITDKSSSSDTCPQKLNFRFSEMLRMSAAAHKVHLQINYCVYQSFHKSILQKCCRYSIVRRHANQQCIPAADQSESATITKSKSNQFTGVVV